MNNLRDIAWKFNPVLKKIKVCAFDCDGILTDGSVFWSGSQIGWNRMTDTRDGYGMKILQGAGLKVGVISGGSSLSLYKRFIENLKLDFLHTGSDDKRPAYNKILAQGYKDEEILYMGDEFFDIPLIKKCGFGATVSNASYEVQEAADYVAATPAGCGAAREVIDILRYAQNIVPLIPDFIPTNPK